jgi:hypothetical protein
MEHHQVKLYTLTRIPGGALELRAEAEVIDKDSKGRSIGKHIETEITSEGYDTGNASDETKALAAKIMEHYYGAVGAKGEVDAGAAAEAMRREKPFLDGFLVHHNMPLGAKYEISSDVLDRFFSLTQS